MPATGAASGGGQDSWDVVVVGGGPAGENVADYAHRGSGLSSVIVEASLLGGECSYWACMPSKALLRPADALEAARHLRGAAGAVGGRGLDVGAAFERRDDFTNHHDDASQASWARDAGVDVVRGRGRLVGVRAVEVETPDGALRRLEARRAVVLATGTRPSVPDVPGLRAARPWTSRDVTNLHEVPRSVVVLGGGPVACEAATWLRALGCGAVVLVEQADRLLGRTEPFAGELVAERFARDGVDVLLRREVVRVERPEVSDAGEGLVRGGPVKVMLDDGSTREVDEIVVAAGRTPNSDGLGLDVVGVSANVAGFVEVDEHLTVPGTDWLYVVGDLCGRSLLTHMGKYQGRVAGEVIAARAAGRPLLGRHLRDVADDGAVPQVTFTDPEVGSVGHTADSARAAGIDVDVVDHDLGAVAGAALARDGYAGRARLVVDRSSGTIAGATFVGAGVGELVHSATVAVVGRVPVDVLWHAVPSYPTISEVWLRLLEDLRRVADGPYRARD